MTNAIEVPVLYLDSVLQTMEQLLHEVDDDAAPVDAGALIEETREYLERAAGDQSASKEKESDDSVEEASTEEGREVQPA